MQVTHKQIFEVLGVYFSNCYWNHLYDSALNAWPEGGYENLDDAYKNVASKYNQAFGRKANKDERVNKHYVNITEDIHKSYCVWTSSSETYWGFIDTVVRFLIPKEYYEGIPARDERKNQIFHNVMTRTLTEFTLFVLQDLGQVLDKTVRGEKQKSTECVKSWKNKFIELLSKERNNLCSLILAKGSGVDIRDPSQLGSIPKEVCDKLTNKIKHLITEREQMIKERNQYALLSKKYKEIIQKQASAIGQMKEARPRRRSVIQSQPAPTIGTVVSTELLTAPPTPAEDAMMDRIIEEVENIEFSDEEEEQDEEIIPEDPDELSGLVDEGDFAPDD